MTTFLQVHGAFRGACSWDRVAALLRARGHVVVVPTLTGMGEKAHLLSPRQNVDAYAEDIIGELRCRDLVDVTLVAHTPSAATPQRWRRTRNGSGSVGWSTWMRRHRSTARRTSMPRQVRLPPGSTRLVLTAGPSRPSRSRPLS